MLLSLFSTGLLLILTLLPLSNSGIWWVRIAEFPRLQLLVWSFLNVVACLLWSTAPWVWWLIFFNCACAAYHMYWIYGYFPFMPVEVPLYKPDESARSSVATIRILSANVLMTNPNKQAFIDLVAQHDPDLVITLETDDSWQEALDTLEKDYKYTVKVPFDNLYGMHLYARLPLREIHVEYLVKEDIPSIHCICEIGSGKDVHMHVMHPMPPSPTEAKTSTARDAELIMVAKRISQKNVPTLVAGDLNDVAWSKTSRLFKHLSGLLDPRTGRGFFNTFHAAYPFLRWPLDHIFHSCHFTLQTLKRLPLKGSDHYALFSSLVLSEEFAVDESGLSEHEEDLASQRLSEADVSKNTVPHL